MATVTVKNEDGEQLAQFEGTWTVAHARAARFLLDDSEKRRNDIGTNADDSDWIDTLIDNGFYTIESEE